MSCVFLKHTDEWATSLPDSRGGAVIYFAIIELFIGASAKLFFKGGKARMWLESICFNGTQKIEGLVNYFCT